MRLCWFSVVILFFFCNCSFLYSADKNPYKAVVIVPVVDAAGGALGDDFKLSEVVRQYEQFPYAPDKGVYASLRMHQLKYNEVVLVKPVEGNDIEVECVVSNLFYLDHHGKKRSSFWVQSKFVVPLVQLEKKIDLSLIPQPIDMYKLADEYNRDILSLVNPWQHEKTKKWYSAGTRFVRCRGRDTKTKYAFYFIDYDTYETEIEYVSKKSALVVYPKTSKERRALFLKIIRCWAHSQHGFIPYVYGGMSFINRTKRDDFSLVYGKRRGRKVSFWQRNQTEKPATGFDCSGMLLTAAQIAGMPYFFKNTTTLTQDFTKLFKPGDTLEEGDMIWYPGHVMVVSDIKKNLLIEAVGYEAGYGKLHEIALQRVFKGINTYDELVQSYKSKHFKQRLNSKGKPYRSVYRLKILKLL